MPELTPEEKQRIYLEEKERLEAQTRLAGERKTSVSVTQKKVSKKQGGGCALVIIIVAIIVVISILSPKKDGNNSSGSSPSLNAEVRFSGTQIIIKNNDSFDWSNIKIELNAGMLDSGYYYEGGSIGAGQTATIGILNFAKSNGERLNPILIKPRTATILADSPNGRAAYSGKWD